MSLPRLGYWNIRGYVQPVRMLLQYLGVKYEDKRYPIGPAPDFNKEQWLADKFSLGFPFPNLPYWIDEKANVKLTESKAILKFLARTKEPTLVPKTAELLAEAEVVEGFAMDIQTKLIDLTYSPTGIAENPLEVALATHFQSFANLVDKREWALGDKISYVDFYLYEVLVQYEKYNSEILKSYPSLTNYLRRFESIPQLAEYVNATASLPCYTASATLQY